MAGTLLRTFAESAQVEVAFEGGAKYMVPFDRVDFKDPKPVKVVENEYGELTPCTGQAFFTRLSKN